MTRNALILMTLLMLVAGAQFTNLSSANFFPDPGPDLPRIYIRSNGNVEPATAPIERTGNIFKLTGNIVLYTIEIQRDNIMLDGAGHTIQGNASWMGTTPGSRDAGNNGIIIAGRNNVTITRLNIEKCTAGVRISNSSQINIICNVFINGTAPMGTPAGIAIKESSFVLIENNNFTSINGPAILCNGTANTIRGNTLVDGGINLEGSSNLISDNKIETWFPIELDKANSNIITRNKISGPAPSSHLPDQDPNFTGNEGIALFRNCSNNIIFANNITGFVNQAIRIIDGSNNTVYGNYLANNGFAIALGGMGQPVNNTFYGNTFTANSCKIQINDDVYGTFWDNGTIGNYWGDYNGTDSNGDGIGEVQYIVNGFKWDNDAGGLVSFVSGQDNYPLLEPYDIEHAKIVLSQTEPFLAVLTAVAVAVVVGAGLLVYRKKRKRGLVAV